VPANVAVAKPEEAKPVAQVVETVPAPLAAAPVAAVPTPYIPAQEEIAALAYTYWEARGYQGGCPEEDWLRAESELRARGPIQA